MAQESDEALLARIDALEAQNQELKGLVNDLKAEQAAAPAGEKTLTKKEQKAADAKAADEKAEAKAHAAATKEGGKKGQDLSGMCDLGGMKYFTVAMEKCQGRWDLLED